jgi:CRISPR-associated endonuclease/helicase Cas3
VRLFGLAHKTVIFDEVHAYDTYMSELLDYLLRWLAAVGCSVIVLSATLPSGRRQKLLEAYAGRALDDVPQAHYPRMTWVSGGQPGATGLPMGHERTIRISHLPDDPAGLANRLREALAEGGCAAIVCNAVGRAQAMYRALQEAAWARDEIDLFHARFPFGEREAREQRTLRRFGRDGERPQRCVLVATQVIEQSLDLDFDLLVTDLAPVDLVLQRAGRLHRHDRPQRPTHLRDPQLWVVEPPDAHGAPPHFGDSEYIYERYLLLRTHLLLRDRDTLTLPAEIEGLVEDVYTGAAPAGLPAEWMQALEEAQEAAAKEREDDEWKAGQVRVPLTADADDLAEQYNAELTEDEDPRTHATLRAATRLTRPTVALVCLHGQPDGTLTLDSAGKNPTSLDAPPGMEQTEQLLRAAVSSSHWRVVKQFLSADPPTAWRRNPLLRFHRLAVFTAGVCEQPGFRLALDPDLGLIVDTGEKAGGESTWVCPTT